MANDTIQQHHVTEFSDRVHVEAQQMKSRTAGLPIIKTVTGDKFAYDRINTVEMREISGRHQPVTFDSIDHSRRKIPQKRFVVALPIDKADAVATLQDQDANYAKAVAMAKNRQIDRIFVDACTADVATGEDFSTTVTFANDGGLTVDATAGLTFEKTNELSENFINNDVGNDLDLAFALLVTGDEHTKLMQETEFTSGDFSRRFFIDRGRLTEANGYKVILFAADANTPMLGVASNVRTNLAVAQGAVCVGISKEFELEVEKRNDLFNTTQILVTGIIGAVRTEGKLVQKLTTTPT